MSTKIRRLHCFLAACVILFSPARFHARASESLEAGFATPPEETKPWCYWYWISDNISKEGITRDLEAMARVGIGEAFIGNIFLDDVPAGKTKVLTPEWWGLVEHAIREGGRTGVNIGMFNCPGWSQSGGPWIKSSESMRYLVTSEVHLGGPCRLTTTIPPAKQPFEDVAILAFPAPEKDADSIVLHRPRVTCTPAVEGAERLVDGIPATSVAFPGNAGRGNEPFTIDLEVNKPFTARSLEIVPTDEAFGAECELQAATGEEGFHTVRQFRCDRSNMALGVGFMPKGPVTISFPLMTATKFRLLFKGFFGGSRPVLAEINLSGAARLEAFVEKQLGKMHPTPLPMWDTYLWPTQAEPDSTKLTVPAGDVRDLTKHLAPDGTLTWDVPPGDWVIQRIGMTPTGMKNAPASPEGIGLEVDKMNRALARRHFDAFIGEALRRIPAANRKAFKRVVADSYEMGSQNWTDGFDTQFSRRYGYDPKRWLPVLSGRLVGNADQSERFLWDLRRLVADRVATEYVGGLREACRANGLGLWLENYGHWGFPSEFLKYGSESDRIGGEYWVTGDLGSIELRAASSCANTYGRKFVSAESFTGGPAFQNAPGALKARGDWSFCEGVNHFVLHVCIQQPWEDRVPGVNAWFGSEFNRHNTWFERSKAWVDYVRRCCWLLQQGNRVADVAYFIGEDAPKMTGVRKPDLPSGHDFDYINADVIETKLSVTNGLLALPHGTRYRVLVLPQLDTMRPEVLHKIRDLVRAGATVLGPAPSRSPSLENYPKCDRQVRSLANELWGSVEPATPTGERRHGKGRVVWGKSLEDVLGSLNAPADFLSSAPLRYTHRRQGSTEIYFVANPKAESVITTAAFRSGCKAPELWWPDSGLIERPAVYEIENGIVRLPVSLGPQGSVFVVFRDEALPSSQRIIAVKREGQEVLGTTLSVSKTIEAEGSSNNFSFAGWVKPSGMTTLVGEAVRGVTGMGEPRNDVITPPHGNTFGGEGHAGSGLAVGTNGICVFEHGANYFAPPLVHAAELTNWTHVAVVYREGQPTLYVNGTPARKGLKSEHIVHSGASAGGQSQFRGKAGTITQIPRSLTDPEVAALAQATPRPDQLVTGPLIQLTREGASIVIRTKEAGTYQLQFADGRSRIVEATAPAAPLQTIPGPWEVQFTPGWGAPERVRFDEPSDWAQNPDDGIRHYSGRATYRRTFELNASALAPSSRILLDLGEVRDVATVRVNGVELGTLWMAPWSVDATKALKAGANTLEVEVINVWNNRLVGDAALPPAQRKTVLLAPTVGKNAPLLPAGLLGPVRLIPSSVQTLN